MPSRSRRLPSAILALLLLDPAAARASAAAPWPARAEGRSLPREPWVLVVPARRTADGGLVIWERDDPWTKEWRVPRVVDGLRVVTLFGDAEDRRSVTPAAIDGMLIASLGIVQRKYGAPAIALAVTDGAEVAVAGYVPGWPASWKGVAAGDGEEAARDAAVHALAGMFKGGGRPSVGDEPREPGDEAKSPSPVATAAAAVAVIAQRDAPDGGAEYRVAVSGADAAGAVRRLGAIPGVSLVDDASPSDGGLRVRLRFAGGVDDLERALRSAGLAGPRGDAQGDGE